MKKSTSRRNFCGYRCHVNMGTHVPIFAGGNGDPLVKIHPPSPLPHLRGASRGLEDSPMISSSTIIIREDGYPKGWSKEDKEALKGSNL